MVAKADEFPGNWNAVNLDDGFWGSCDYELFMLIEDGIGNWDYIEPEDIPSSNQTKKVTKALAAHGEIMVMLWACGDPANGAYTKTFELPK